MNLKEYLKQKRFRKPKAANALITDVDTTRPKDSQGQYESEELAKIAAEGDKDGDRRKSHQLEVGDVVEITGNVNFHGQTGEITRFGPNKKTVVVRLYNGGEHPFHSPDVSEADLSHEEHPAGDEDHETFYVAFYDSNEERAWVGKVSKEHGGKWHEKSYKGKADHRWGQTYMAYLTPEDIMTWIHKDYARSIEIEGPFYDAAEAADYVRDNWGKLDESIQEESLPEFAVTFTRGTVVGARSHRFIDVHAKDEDEAEKLAVAQFRKEFPGEKGFKISNVHKYHGSLDETRHNHPHNGKDHMACNECKKRREAYAKQGMTKREQQEMTRYEHEQETSSPLPEARGKLTPSPKKPAGESSFDKKRKGYENGQGKKPSNKMFELEFDPRTPDYPIIVDEADKMQHFHPTMKTHKLIDAKGKEVKVGDKLKDFRGEENEVVGWEAPRHAGSTGRIHVKSRMPSGSNSYFPSVYDTKVVPREGVKESAEYLNYSNWKQSVLLSHPTLSKKIVFRGKMEGEKTVITAVIPGENKVYGIWDDAIETGKVLNEG